jgi:hypothetical protein
MFNKKFLNSSHPRRKRGRPPKDVSQPIKKVHKFTILVHKIIEKLSGS